MNRLTVKATATAAVAAGALFATAAPGIADPPVKAVTTGELHAFASGTGMDISGRAWMLRAPNGTTRVLLTVRGLDPRTTYPSHVHSAPCGVDDANGHYMFDPAGPPEPPNEIWVGPFTTSRFGTAVASTSVDAIAGPEAVAVVVHAPDGSKIACADLR